ncbi:MAG TPA: PIG-L family deacetylase [Vicinamibacterales bacterium]|jgi:LmbE family N-acetylglucosaminyl deacetylase
MKPTQTSQPDLPPLLAFGAHPDDIEFGCGGVIALETRAGRAAHLVICSRGEAGTNGTPEQRAAEAQRSAALLGATVQFIELDGDAHLEIRTIHAIRLAEIIRRVRPAIVLAPSLVENQHPDHPRLGAIVRDAARLARYGGVAELRGQPPHAIEQLLFYAVSADAEPAGATPVLVDVSDPDVIDAWSKSMEAHATQAVTRNYVDMQLSRARLNGLRAGVKHAIALFPSDPIVVNSLAQVGRGARSF